MDRYGKRLTEFFRMFVGCILFLFVPPAVAEDSITTYLTTAADDSFSTFAAKTLCHSVNRSASGIVCQVVAGKSSVDILTNIENGFVDFALVNAREIYNAINGYGPFEFVAINYEDLRLILPLYREPITLLVRKDAGIERLSELRSRRVNSGGALSREALIFDEIMQVMRWTKESFAVYQTLSRTRSQDVIAFDNGTIEALLHVGMHPDQRVRRRIVSGKGRLLPVAGAEFERLVADREGFCFCSLEGADYNGGSFAEKTLSIETLLISSADIDEDIVGGVLKAIYQRKEGLQRTHGAFLKQDVDVKTLNDSYLHPHPAAVLFFQQYLNQI